MAGRLIVGVVRARPLVSHGYVWRCVSVAAINTVVGDLLGVQQLL
jgi:hypothetical protein